MSEGIWEGAKGVLTGWRDGLPRVSCTSAALSCTSATGFWFTCAKTPFAPSPNLGKPPARHRGLPGLSGPEPQKRKESERVSRGRSPRVPKECAPESEKGPKRVRSCVFGLFSDSMGHSWGTPRPGAPGHPFDSFLFRGSGPEGFRRPVTSVTGRRVPDFFVTLQVWALLRFRTAVTQRVLSGGLDPWGVGSANLGRPIFASIFPQTPLKQVFSSKLGAEMGRPKFADPTPHGSNPSLKTLWVTGTPGLNRKSASA